MRNTWNILQELKYLQGISYVLSKTQKRNTWNTSWKLLKLTPLGYEIKVDLWNNEWCSVHLNLLVLGSTPRTIIDHNRAPTIDKEKQMRKRRFQFQFSSVRYDLATTINKSVIMTMVELLWTLKTGQAIAETVALATPLAAPLNTLARLLGPRSVCAHGAEVDLNWFSTTFQNASDKLVHALNWF